jgi:hypothetical protein
MRCIYKHALTKGQGFGEIGLNIPRGRRTATVIAQEDTHFGVISRNIYEELFETFINNEIKENYNFFVKNFFPEMGTTKILQLLYLFDKLHFVENQHAYK